MCRRRNKTSNDMFFLSFCFFLLCFAFSLFFSVRKKYMMRVKEQREREKDTEEQKERKITESVYLQSLPDDKREQDH